MTRRGRRRICRSGRPGAAKPELAPPRRGGAGRICAVSNHHPVV